MKQKQMRVFDLMMFAVAALIGLLLLTGGVRTAHWELAQVDAWAWTLLLLALLRSKIRDGEFWPPLPARLSKPVQNVSTALRGTRPVVLVLVVMAVHVLLYSWACVRGYESFNFNAYDLGYIDQAVWSTGHMPWPAGFMHSTLSKGDTYLAEHFSPVLALLSPLYLVYSSVWWLFLVQSILLSSGAWFVFKFCKKAQLDTATSLVLVVCYFWYQPLRAANLFTFREDYFFIPLFFVALDSVTIEKPTPRQRALFWGAVAASFFVKENAALVTFALGFWLCMRQRRREGLALCALSLLVFSVINKHVIPHFSMSQGNTVLVSRLGALGSTSGEIFSNLLGHPFESAFKIVGPLFNGETFKYLVLVLLPFSMPFMAVSPKALARLPGAAALCLMIGLGLTLMNLMITQRTVGFHYECIAIPFLFTFLIASFPLVIKAWGRTRACALVLVLFLCVFGRSPILALREWQPSPAQRCLGRALKQLPQDASIATISSLQPHLDHRPVAGLLQRPTDLSEDLVVISRLEGLSIYATPLVWEHVARLDRSTYDSVVEGPIIQVFCRRSFCGAAKAAGSERFAWIDRLKEINNAAKVCL